MPAADLARREGVELVRTGSWALLSGSWEPTRADIVAAVEAQQCPAIKNPKIKLGHIDPRFDGQPAMGWFENLRTTDGGHTLLADQVTLSWLNNVQAAAYPDRSVEGNYRHKCGLGHTHPFVITAVALLGVTPPGVSTLKSLQDLPDMLGVAASEEVPDGAQHVQVTIRAAADGQTGAMVALVPAAEDAQRLAAQGGESADQLHVTLAYLGEAASLGAHGQQDVIDAVSSAVNGMPAIDADVFSLNVFNPGDVNTRDTCIALGVSGDMLDVVHDMVDGALQGLDIPPQTRPWVAHLTLQYTDDLSKLAELTDRIGPVAFDRLRIAFAGQVIDIPLIDQPDEVGGFASEPAMVAAAADENQLKTYWTKSAAGLAKWRDKPHPWRALYSHLVKFLGVERAKRVTSQWYRDVLGHTPNEKGVKAGAGEGAPPMSRAEKIRAAWNKSGAPHSQWVQEARTDAAIVVDDVDRSYRLYPVTFDGDAVLFGEPQAYDPEVDTVLVYASRADSRPDVTVDPPQDPGPLPDSNPPAEPAPNLPAAEPEPENTDPNEEGLVSTDLSAFRSRLGLDDTADETALLAAFDAALTKAETPAEPTPDMVAASAAAEEEKSELRKEVQVLASQVQTMSTRIAAAEAEKAATVKQSVIQAAADQGKFTPAEREQWEKDYDQAPAAITRILASIAPGYKVPVSASGVAGSPEPTGLDFDEDEMSKAFFGPNFQLETKEA